MTRCSLAVLFLAVLVATAWAAPKEKVKLERRNAVGQWLLVKERQWKESRNSWKAPGAGAAGGEELEDTDREFEQKVASEKPLVLKRTYRSSKRLKRHPRNSGAEPQSTSVHGKTVVIGPDGMNIEGGAEMSKDDREHLTTVQKIVESCLPRDEVAVGEDWRVRGEDIGRAIFGPAIDPTNFGNQGIGKLERLVANQDGTRTAHLVLKVVIKVKPTEVLPAIDLELKGKAQFHVEEGVFTAFELEGPFRFEGHKSEDGAEATWKSEGTTRFVCKAEILMPGKEAAARGARDGAAAKDGELALARKVGCKNGHDFDVGYPFCGLCGKKMDEATKLCPAGCVFIVRHCPLCGEPCAPRGDGK